MVVSYDSFLTFMWSGKHNTCMRKVAKIFIAHKFT